MKQNQEIQLLQQEPQNLASSDEFRDENTIVVNNLPYQITLEIFYHKLQFNYKIDLSQISRIQITPRAPKTPKGMIELTTKEYAEKIRKDLNGKLMLNKFMEVKIKRPKELIASSKQFYFKIINNPNNKILDVNNFEEFFQQFGEILFIKLGSNQEKLLSYGYVSFRGASLKDTSNYQITKITENQEMQMKLDDLDLILTAFQQKSQRQKQLMYLRMSHFASQIPEEEINKMREDPSLKDLKEKQYKLEIEQKIPQDFLKKVQVVVDFDLESRMPVAYVNNIETNDEISKIRSALSAGFAEFLPEITKSGKVVAILLQNVKENCNLNELIAVIESNYGQVRKFKNQKGEEIKATINMPKSTGDPKNGNLISNYVIFTFVDQDVNENFILGYFKNDMLKPFFNDKPKATFKLSVGEVMVLNKLKPKKKLNLPGTNQGEQIYSLQAGGLDNNNQRQAQFSQGMGGQYQQSYQQQPLINSYYNPMYLNQLVPPQMIQMFNQQIQASFVQPNINLGYNYRRQQPYQQQIQGERQFYNTQQGRMPYGYPQSKPQWVTRNPGRQNQGQNQNQDQQQQSMKPSFSTIDELKANINEFKALESNSQIAILKNLLKPSVLKSATDEEAQQIIDVLASSKLEEILSFFNDAALLNQKIAEIKENNKKQ